MRGYMISFEFFHKLLYCWSNEVSVVNFFSDIHVWPNLWQKNSSVDTDHDDLYLRRFCRRRLHDGIIYFHDKAFFTSHTYLGTKMISSPPWIHLCDGHVLASAKIAWDVTASRGGAKRRRAHFCRTRGSLVFSAWKSRDVHLSGWFTLYTGCRLVVEPNFNVWFSNSDHVMAR